MKMHLETGAMTERDKTLLSAMAIAILLVVLGWFVFKPLVEQNIELNKHAAELESQRADAQDKLSMLENERNLNDSMMQQYLAATDSFYPMMQSTEIDRLLTSMVLGRGLAAVNLSITMPQDLTDVKPYQYSVDGVQTQDDSADTASGVYAATVSMSISGSKADLQQFIDTLYTDAPAIRIVSYAWNVTNVVSADGVTASPGANNTDAQQAVLSLNMEIYMTDGVVVGADTPVQPEASQPPAESSADSLETLYQSKDN